MNNNTAGSSLFELQIKINISMIAILSFFCITGNSLSIYIMTKPKFFKIPLFRFSAVATLLSIFRLFCWIVGAYPNEFGVTKSGLNCTMFYYLAYIPHQVATWIVVWTGIDCYISVRYPIKFQFRNKIQYQALIIFIILVLNLLNDIPNIFLFEFVQNDCIVTNYETATIVLIESGFLCTVLPGCLMILFSCLIYKRLSENKKKLGVNQKKEISLFKTFISTYILFLVCYVPYYISFLVFNILKIPFERSIVWQIDQYLCSFYSAFDFFIYFFSNRIFREHCMKTFGLSCCSVKNKQKFENILKTNAISKI